MPKRMTPQMIERRKIDGGTIGVRLMPQDWEILHELLALTGADGSTAMRMLLRQWARRHEQQGKAGLLA